MSHLLSGGEGSLQLDGASSITRSTSYMPKNVSAWVYNCGWIFERNGWKMELKIFFNGLDLGVIFKPFEMNNFLLLSFVQSSFMSMPPWSMYHVTSFIHMTTYRTYFKKSWTDDQKKIQNTWNSIETWVAWK